MTLQGIKFSGVLNYSASECEVHPICIVDASLNYSPTIEKRKCYIDGNCTPQTVATILTEEEYSLTLDTNIVDSNMLAIMMGERWETSSDVVLPSYIATAKPDPATGIITDANITGATLDSSTVAISVAKPSLNGSGTGMNGPLTVVAGAAPGAATEAAVQAGQIAVDPSIADASIKYIVKRNAATIESLGCESPIRPLDNLSFFGELCLDCEKVYIYVESMTPESGFDLDLSGQDTASLTFSLNTISGNRKPVKFFREPATA